MHYFISQPEIARRKKAYLTFSSHIIIGMFIGSLVTHSFLFSGFYIATITALFFIGVYSFHFFRKLAQTVIHIDAEYITKKTPHLTERYLLSSINRIEVKRTTENTIREIYLWFTDGTSVFVTGLEKFAAFETDLFSHTPSTARITTKQERIAFDHPLFYILLGSFTGLCNFFGFRLLLTLDRNGIHLLSFLLFIYSMILGLYFFIAKPSAKRSGRITSYFDYIAGITLIALGIFVLVYV